MTMNEFVESLTPLYSAPESADIAAAEAKLSKRFPSEYAEFLRRCNGGAFDATHMALVPSLREAISPALNEEGPRWGALLLLYGVPTSRFNPTDSEHVAIFDRRSDLIDEQSSYDFDRWYPERILCVGEFFMYYSLAISCRGEDEGAVYVGTAHGWFPEDEIDPHSEDVLTRIASSWNEFLESCLVPVSDTWNLT